MLSRISHRGTRIGLEFRPCEPIPGQPRMQLDAVGNTVQRVGGSCWPSTNFTGEGARPNARACLDSTLVDRAPSLTQSAGIDEIPVHPRHSQRETAHIGCSTMLTHASHPCRYGRLGSQPVCESRQTPCEQHHHVIGSVVSPASSVRTQPRHHERDLLGAGRRVGRRHPQSLRCPDPTLARLTRRNLRLDSPVAVTTGIPQPAVMAPEQSDSVEARVP